MYEFIDAFTRVSACMAYEDDYKGVIDSSLTALELSIDEADDSVDRARMAYDEITYLGLCDQDYTLPGSEPCSDLKGAFMVVDSGNSEGKYGKVNALKSSILELKSNLKDDAPVMSPFYTSMGLIWDDKNQESGQGIITTFSNLESAAIKAKADAEYEYDYLHTAAMARKSQTDSELARLDSEKLSLIDRAPEGFGARSTGSISERIQDLELASEGISDKLSDAEILRISLNHQGYLADSILLLQMADEGYIELGYEIDELELDAIDTVDQQKQEAQDEIGDTEAAFRSSIPTPEMESLLQEAKDKFDSAEASSALGDRYEAYEESAALARSARLSPGMFDTVEKTSTLAELEDLIARAELDEINVISEKETLALLKGSSSLDVSLYAEEAIDSIIGKAMIKYEDDLLDSRARIVDKLSLAGYAAADLQTDLQNYEEGIMEDGRLIYPDSIGSLRRLSQDYLELEATLDLYMSDILGNVMSVSADPVIIGAVLDQPADVLLDVQLSNDRPYGGTGPQVRVRMSYSLPFLYSDITEGRDEVESLLMEDKDKTISMFLTYVEPYESKRIVFEKRQVVARTISRKALAQGIGYETAEVEETIEFESDYPLLRFTPPYGYDSVLIDGYPPGRALDSGRHQILLEDTVTDAYDETISNINAYPMGLNSKVDYTITITPAMDLDSVMVFVNALDDDHVTNLNIVTVTGEKIVDKQRVSDTQMTLKVMGLEEGRPSILRVSYTVSNSQEYVVSQIEGMEASPLSDEAQELLESAKLQAAGGDYAAALEFIEKAKAQSVEDEKSLEKARTAYEALEKEFLFELAEIDSALGYKDVTGLLHDRLVSRKAELESALEKAGEMEPEAGIEALGKLDKNWLSKELTSFRKEVYKSYTDLKERFLASGNSTTPQEFMDLESALIRLDTGGKLEYALDVASALSQAERIVEYQESSESSSQASLAASFDSLKAQVLITLDDYLAEQATAKGTEYASYFSESESSVQKKIEAASKAITGDRRIFEQKMSDLIRVNDKMKGTLSSLEKEAEAKYSLVQTLVSQAPLDSSKKAELEKMLQSVEAFLDEGEHINALRAASAVAKELDGAPQKNETGLLLLGLAALSVIITIAVYIIKHNEKGGPKPLRKLQKIEDPEKGSKTLDPLPEEKPLSPQKSPGLGETISDLLD